MGKNAVEAVVEAVVVDVVVDVVADVVLVDETDIKILKVGKFTVENAGGDTC
jgi:hypothetical protein